MAQIRYTLVLEESDVYSEQTDIPRLAVFTRAMRADSPVLRHLCPALPSRHGYGYGYVYKLIDKDNLGWLIQQGYTGTSNGLSVLQAAAIMAINIEYHANTVDISKLPRDNAISFTPEELHTDTSFDEDGRYRGDEIHAYKSKLVIGWTKKQLMDVVCEFGFSKHTEKVVVMRGNDDPKREGPAYGKRAVRRIRYMIADYNRRRRMLVIRSLAYPEYDGEGQVRRAALPADVVMAIMAAAGCTTR